MIVTVLGRKRFGKTAYLTRRTIDYRREHPERPVFIRDLRGWAGGPSVVIGALAPPHARWRDTDEFYRRGVRDGRLVSTVNLFYRCPAEDVCALAGWYIDHRVPALVVIDELDQLPPQLDQRKSAAYRLVHYGSFAGVDLFGSARQPQNIDKALLSQADELVIFNLTTKQVLCQLREFGTREAEEAARIAPGLARFRYVKLEP